MTDPRCCDGDDELGIMIVPAIKIAPSLPRRLPRPSLTKGSMEMSASRNKIAAPAKAKSPRLFSRSTHVLEIPRLITTAGVASPALANLLRTDPTQRHKCWYREQGDTKKMAVFDSNCAIMPKPAAVRAFPAASKRWLRPILADIARHPTRPRLMAPIAGPMMPPVAPCNISAANTTGKFGHNASNIALAPIIKIPSATSSRFRLTASTSAPPGN